MDEIVSAIDQPSRTNSGHGVLDGISKRRKIHRFRGLLIQSHGGWIDHHENRTTAPSAAVNDADIAMR
ncbi:MAG: hypothetical protein AAGE94_06415 [Acidobacteriota bacterium]